MIQDCQTQRTECMLKPTPRVNRSDADQVSGPTVRTLFETEEKPLLRYAFAMLGRRAVAEEIVQDVFLQLHRRWDQIDSPRAWLYRSVRNRVFNHVRDHRRELLGSDEGDIASTDDQNDTPEVVLVRMEATAAVRKMLGELDAMDQQLVKLKYFEGLEVSRHQRSNRSQRQQCGISTAPHSETVGRQTAFTRNR